MLLGAAVIVVWLLFGVGVVRLVRRDLAEETFNALVNCALWPAIAVSGIIHRIKFKINEQHRQQRISEMVASGEITSKQAKQIYKWRG